MTAPPNPSGPPRDLAGRRRTRQVVGVTVAAIVLSAGGLVASTFIKSPEDFRASAAPPSPTQLTAIVERRVLNRTLVARGTVTATRRIEITPVAEEAKAQVLTRVSIKAGEEIKPGRVMLAVAGRPLIALKGRIPGYRDLKPGDSGDDVQQLQHALEGLGKYHRGDRAGYFGSATKAAVRRLYESVGYDVADTGSPDTGSTGRREQQRALDEAKAAVADARRVVKALKRQSARSTGDASPTAGDGVDRRDPGIDVATADQLATARSQLRIAEDAYAGLVATTGPMLPLAEFFFVPGFPARVTEVNGAVGETVKAPLLTVATGALAVRMKLRPDDAALLRRGMAATLLSEALGTESKATVSKIGQLTAPGPDDDGAPYQPVVLQPTKPLGASWADLDVRVTVTAAQTEQPVLLVPLSAVSTGADSRVIVNVRRADGVLSRVEVQVGVSGDGYVQITAKGADVAEGDLVVVGMQ